MKTLQTIKEAYAEKRRFKNWEHFCLVANDNMFIQAIDEIAELFAKKRITETLNFRNIKAPNNPATGLFRKKRQTLQFNNLK